MDNRERARKFLVGRGYVGGCPAEDDLTAEFDAVAAEAISERVRNTVRRCPKCDSLWDEQKPKPTLEGPHWECLQSPDEKLQSLGQRTRDLRDAVRELQSKH